MNRRTCSLFVNTAKTVKSLYEFLCGYIPADTSKSALNDKAWMSFDWYVESCRVPTGLVKEKIAITEACVHWWDLDYGCPAPWMIVDMRHQGQLTACKMSPCTLREYRVHPVSNVAVLRWAKFNVQSGFQLNK